MSGTVEHSTVIRVYYEDTDSGGVVYYANYLRFLERARTELLRSLGFEQDSLISERDILFAVARVEIDYLVPARFNDLVEVTACVREARRVAMVFEQEMRRQTDNELLASAVVRVACLSASQFKPTPIPTDIRGKLQP